MVEPLKIQYRRLLRKLLQTLKKHWKLILNLKLILEYTFG